MIFALKPRSEGMGHDHQARWSCVIGRHASELGRREYRHSSPELCRSPCSHHAAAPEPITTTSDTSNPPCERDGREACRTNACAGV